MSSTDNNGKNPAKKEPKASIGSDGRYYGEIGESQEIIELKTPRQIIKKENSVKTPVVEKFKKQTGSPAEKKSEIEKVETDKEQEPDIFDEEGNIIENESELQAKIAALKESIAIIFSQLVEGIRERLEGPFNKVKSITLKIFTGFLIAFGKVFSGFNQTFSKLLGIKKEEIVQKNEVNEKDSEKEKPVPEGSFVKAGFNDMANLNVFFTDNYDTALYKKKKTGSQEFSSAENSIMILNAIDAIKQCAEFTKDVPTPQEGFYKGIPVSRVMTEVTESDISFFLGYVKAKPKKYTGKSWKISETFATWLVSNAPMVEIKK